jgi:hypothetical protein
MDEEGVGQRFAIFPVDGRVEEDVARPITVRRALRYRFQNIRLFSPPGPGLVDKSSS